MVHRPLFAPNFPIFHFSFCFLHFLAVSLPKEPLLKTGEISIIAPQKIIAPFMEAYSGELLSCACKQRFLFLTLAVPSRFTG